MSTNTASRNPEPIADPYADLTAEDSGPLVIGAGRKTRPLIPSVVALVENSWNKGEPKNLQVKTGSEDQAKELKKELQRTGKAHNPELTVRVVIREDKVSVAFKAGPKQERKAKEEATPSA